MENEEIEKVIGEDNTEVIDIKSDIISMIFTDLYYKLGAPSIEKLEHFDIDEEEFSNPTKETIIKLKNYAESINSIKTR